MSLALTRIRLHGFKTFAQRVEIELATNLTAIVGPNGCGKSNLVDALMWALGEANVRTLRAQTPTEVLFSGSATHKPLGLAEVALWFNNESRWLPLDADEVQITRRLYRSGEWECWINRTPARLRDLADLFAGTGLGRGGYAMVGQGDIEALLTALPEERRRWLEEVAGVALYRARRKDALRDLESARLHLTRVDDVLRELERQREPMRLEAERALVYRELQRQLTALERDALLYEYRTLRQRMQQAQTERDALRELILHTELAIAEQEAQAETYGQVIAHLESAMDTLRTVLQSQLTAEERTLGELNRLEERERALQELARTLQEETESLHAQQAERETRIAELRAELQATEAEAQSLRPVAHRSEQQVQLLEQQRRQLETAYQSALRQQGALAQAQHQYERLQAESVATQTRLQQLRREAESLQTEHQTLQAQETALQTQADTLEAAQAQSERELQHLIRETQTQTRTVEALRARVRALESSLQAGEGASPAVRALLQAVRKGELQGEFVPVGAALTVPEQYQAAIRAALGGAVNDIITPTEAEARAAVEWLQRHRAGRLTFLPLDFVEPRSTDSLPCAPESGVIGVAADLVAYDPRFEPAIRHLLGRVLVVDTLETATGLVREQRWKARGRAAGEASFSRIATLDGAVVQLSGTITGGTSANERSSLLHLKAELERARAELLTAETRLQETETALEQQRTQHFERQHKLEALRRQLRETAQQRLRVEGELKHLMREAQRQEALLRQVQAQLQQLESQLSAPADADLATLEAERERLQRDYEAHTRALAQQRAQLQQIEERRGALRRQIDAEQRTLEHLRARRQSLLSRLQALEQERTRLTTQRAAAQAELERIRLQIQHAQAELDT
ncbi:MAG: AAA family ATPase, partial [Fimbriimonadales bacterium]